MIWINGSGGGQATGPGMRPPELTQECLARYGSAAIPRYTSYPTAPHFSPLVGEADYRGWLRAVTHGTSVSAYFHVPFCRAMCWYCGCHTSVTARSEPIARYVRSLEREIELVALEIPARLAVEHLHFGGGTPTLMEPEQLAGLMAALRTWFDVAPGAEIAVEIDPRTLSAGMAVMLGREGFTRASLGVQSFDPLVQRAINRIQTFGQTMAAASELRRHGVMSINLDLIYGLPHQTVRSCLETVDQALQIRPDRLSVFGYAHVPSFKRHQRRIEEKALPDSAERWAQVRAIAGALASAGFVQIGLDHFARADDALARAAASGTLRRNFQGYTTDAAPALIGFGASAIGRFPQGYVQNSVLASDYQSRLAEGLLPVARGYALSDEDRLRGRIIERLMCDYEVDVGEICATFGRDAGQIFPAEALARLESDGLVRTDRHRVEILPLAHPLVRSVAAAFDPYLERGEGRHARAV